MRVQTCPRCSGSFSAPAELHGTTQACPWCQMAVVIDATPEPVPPPIAPPVPPPVASPATPLVIQTYQTQPQVSFRCPFCGCQQWPVVVSVVSIHGWIAFAILLLVFFPLCWVGLFFTTTRRRCRVCGIWLDR
jgi:hypothetical protein